MKSKMLAGFCIVAMLLISSSAQAVSEDFEAMVTSDLDAGIWEMMAGHDAPGIVAGGPGASTKCADLTDDPTYTEAFPSERVNFTYPDDWEYTGFVEFDLYLNHLDYYDPCDPCTLEVRAPGAEISVTDHNGNSMAYLVVQAGWGGDPCDANIPDIVTSLAGDNPVMDVMSKGEWTHFKIIYTVIP